MFGIRDDVRNWGPGCKKGKKKKKKKKGKKK